MFPENFTVVKAMPWGLKGTKSLEVPEEPDVEETHSENDSEARRCSLTFFTAARHARPASSLIHAID